MNLPYTRISNELLGSIRSAWMLWKLNGLTGTVLSPRAKFQLIFDDPKWLTGEADIGLRFATFLTRDQDLSDIGA